MTDTIRPTIDAAQLRIEVCRFDGGVVVMLHGELDLTTAPALTAQMKRLSYQYDAAQVTLDVSELEFVDVRGADALRQAAKMSQDGRMIIQGQAPNLELLLGLVGCGDCFVLHG